MMSPSNEIESDVVPPDVLMLVEIRFETGLRDDIAVRLGDDPETLAKVRMIIIFAKGYK